MCLAIPGKIIVIKEKTAIIQYPHEQREVMLDPLIPVEVGDYVMVQMRIIIQKIDQKQASESQKAWDEITKR
ncbi:MAG: HypC/HybG/HupF family hydrogenase formation chaperone [bacterium]